MALNSDGMKPIYVQISEWLENEILEGHFVSHRKVYSQYQLADLFNINPATAAKGLNILVDENILYKKRGLGMFVETNAKERILAKRRNETLKQLVLDVAIEAERLGVGEPQLIQLIKTARKEMKGETE